MGAVEGALAVVQRPDTMPPATVGGAAFSPRTLAEAIEFAKVLASSDLVPKDYHNKPANVVVAIQWGYELGLHPMQAIQNIAVINGRPSIYGDAMLGLVKSSPTYESVREDFDGQGDDYRAVCIAKRRGQPEVRWEFSVADAKRANLWGKQGPWTQYPRRMLQMRARGFALRDQFPDVLRGMVSREEAMDLPAPEYAEAPPANGSPETAQPTSLPTLPTATPTAPRANGKSHSLTYRCVACERTITKAQHDATLQELGRPLCVWCARKAPAPAPEAAPSGPEEAAPEGGALFPLGEPSGDYEPGAQG